METSDFMNREETTREHKSVLLHEGFHNVILFAVNQSRAFSNAKLIAWKQET